jgi:drug/metabolite transporter (DMT)-like permease
MKYNFYVLLFVVTLFGALSTYLKKDILEDCSILEELLFTTIIILIGTILFYIFYEKKSISYFVDLISKNKNNVTYKLLAFDLLVFFSIIIGGVILKNEYVIKSMPYRTSMYLIAVALLAYIFEHKQLTVHKLIGILVIIMGTFLLEY